MRQFTVNTALIGRAETFKLLGVAHAIRKPILLEGVPGTGKTNALLDYGRAAYNGDAAKMLQETFILETDEDTRAAEIKGRPDLKKIVEQNTYDVITPVKDAKILMINEIDKASGGLRNSMLSIMNEKVLFNGVRKIPVNWELFCASCNKIPSDEIGSPFWDRFLIKHKVKRITKTQMIKYFETGAQVKAETFLLPDMNELREIQAKIPSDKMMKFLDVAHSSLSDRSLSVVPLMASAVSVVFQHDLNQSLVKTAQIMCGSQVSKALSEIIEAKELRDIREQISLIEAMEDYNQIKNSVEDIKRMAKQAAGNPEVTKESLQDIAKSLNATLKGNAFWNPEAMAGRLNKDAVAQTQEANDLPF